MHRDREGIAARALSWLSRPGPEQLLSAMGAILERRALTRDEAAARQEYGQALLRECPWAGPGTVKEFENALSIRRLMIVALAQAVSGQELESAARGLEAQQQGNPVLPEDATALRTCTDEWGRLWRLTGFEAAANAAARKDGAQ